MENNSLLMIVLAFILGYMAPGMMKQMCGSRLVEGSYKLNQSCPFNCSGAEGYTGDIKKNMCDVINYAKEQYIKNHGSLDTCSDINEKSFCLGCPESTPLPDN